MATTADTPRIDATPESAAGPSSAGHSGAPSPTIEHPLNGSSQSSLARDSHEAAAEAPQATSHPTSSGLEPASESPQRQATPAPNATNTATPADDPLASSPAPSPQPQPHSPGQVQPVRPAAPANEEAVQVRGHLIRGLWHNFRSLGRGRRWMFMLRLLISLAQLIPGIVVLSLPTSLGNSPGRAGSECDPEPIFVYLALHVVRVAASLPTELYLAVSPHRNARQRRPTSAGFLERERRRQFGNLEVDRKAARISDLLGFCHVVLFAVGNYTVWSGTACAHHPADSVPLFWTSFSMLSLSYLVILNVIFLIFMIVFFLPLLIGILRALGLGHRIPQQGIRPSTGKIAKDEVDKVTKLVYYVPEDESEPPAEAAEAPLGTSSPTPAGGQTEAESISADQRNSQAQSSSRDTATKQTPLSTSCSPATDADVEQARTRAHQGGRGWTHILGTLLGMARDTGRSPTRHSANATERSGDARTEHTGGLETVKTPDDEEGLSQQRATSRSSRGRKGASGYRSGAAAAPGSKPPTAKKFKYPLHPLPSHRSTCPICLCDFESPVGASTLSGQDANASQTSSGSASQEAEPEPLRLLPCNHVLHASCVDEWLTTVSGRCPVCQRPILKSKDDVEVGGEGPGAGGPDAATRAEEGNRRT